MPRYLVESYSNEAAVDDARERARLTARLGVGVIYVRTTFLPGEETLLHIFEAPSAQALDAAGRLAALEFQRIVEAIDAPAAAAEGSLR